MYRIAGLVVLLMLSFVAIPAGAGFTPCPLVKRWQFRAASPLAGEVAIAADGGVYLSTHEGYVHALSADGRFLWSYTVKGALAGGPTLAASGDIFAASSWGLVYALRRSGNPRWVLQSPIRAATPLMAGPSGTVRFGSQRFLYAASSKAGLLWRAELNGRITAGPVRGPKGAAWLLTDEGTLHRVHSPGRHTKFAVPAHERAELLSVEPEPVLLLDERLIVLTPAGAPRWERAQVSLASSPATIGKRRELVVVTQGKLSWLSPADGRVLRRTPFGQSLSGRPLIAGKYTLLPGSMGQLYIATASRDRAAVTTCNLGSAPMSAPKAAGRGRWVVAAGDGQVIGLELRSALMASTRRVPKSASRKRRRR